MADNKVTEKRLKPNDMTEVYMNNKFYSPGEKASVHENVAANLIKRGKAFKTKAEADKAIVSASKVEPKQDDLDL